MTDNNDEKPHKKTSLLAAKMPNQDNIGKDGEVIYIPMFKPSAKPPEPPELITPTFD